MADLSPELDPQARALLDQMVERQVPPWHTLPHLETRQLYRERRALTQPDPPEVGAVRDLSAPGPAGAIPLRLYLPPGPPAPRPALVFLHGGGWVIGDLDTHDVMCRRLCLEGQCAVVAVDYRLAPEHRFPAPLDDALAAIRWVRAHGAALGLDTTRLAVGGDSAGGNLAAAALITLRDAGEPDARLQLLIYPVIDQRANTPSYRSNGEGYMVTSETMAYFRDLYLPDAQAGLDWRASPILAPRLQGLPPTLVLTAQFDPLRDEGHAYAQALAAAGVPTQYLCAPGQIHGFANMGRVMDAAAPALARCGQALREAFA